jgi:DNA-binding GntR family transcriptional regulator
MVTTIIPTLWLAGDPKACFAGAGAGQKPSSRCTGGSVQAVARSCATGGPVISRVPEKRASTLPHDGDMSLLTTAPPRANLAEQVYAQLKAELHDFTWVPGDRFSEAEIGQRVGVSRTPVREALFRLRNEGLLDVESKSGWFVKPIDFGKLDQLYDLRVVLELDSIAKLVARREDPPALEALKAVWLVPASLRSADAKAVGELDEAFHATLVSAAGNAEIAKVHQDVTERIRIVRRLDFTRADRIEATYQEHAKILRAVIQRKLDVAQMLLKAHIEQSKVEVRKISLHAMHQARQRGAG